MFDFTSRQKAPTKIEPPSLQRYPARDGEQLAYRIYKSAAQRILIFIHGSTYHSGGGYHALAAFLSTTGVAKVVVPNLRGHYQSGRRRGDVDYIGQLEDDIADLITFLRSERMTGPITLGGHSSGGGLTIRFAGGSHALMVSSYLPLAPIIPRSPSVRGGTAGGWANIHWRRLFGLLALNAVGIHGFDGLPIVAFNKPPQFWDGTETLSYSYRLNVSYHPRNNYQADIRGLGEHALVLIGANDEAIDPEALRTIIAAGAPHARVQILPGISHFGVFSEPTALEAVAAWLRRQPEDNDP